MLTEAVNVFLKYILHTIDLRNENPWENKPIYIRYVDIVLGNTLGKSPPTLITFCRCY